MTRPAASRSRRRYPEYREEYGEDPARFLCVDVNPVPRIEGLESVGLCKAYLDVETDGGEPRRHVIAALNQRLADLDDSSIAAKASGGEATA